MNATELELLQRIVDRLNAVERRLGIAETVEQSSNAYSPGGADVAIADGGTGASTAADARANLGVRERLIANRTYYVDGTLGSDSNDGLSSGAAFATIQAGVNAVAAADLGGYTATIQVADGTYSEAVTLKSLVGGNCTIQGDTGTPSNVVLSGSGAGATVVANTLAGAWTLTGMQIQGVGFAGVQCVRSSINLSGVVFGTMSAGFAYHVFCGASGLVTFTANYEIAGNATYHWAAYDGGILVCQSRTVTLTGTPAFTGFLIASRGASVSCNGNTFSGAATGKRYTVTLNAVVDTAGGGTTYLPGSSAGTTATGGQYA